MSTPTTEELAQTWEARGFHCEEHTDSPGTSNPRHACDLDELVVVLEGDVELEMAGKKYRPKQGEEVVIPAGTPHKVRNVGATPARRLHGVEREWAQTD